MKYFLITGRIPETLGQAEVQEHIATKEEPWNVSYSPAVPPVPAHDNRIEIGETNPFDSSGKPFKVTYHETMGITTTDDWKRLINMYGTRISHEYIKTPEGLRQDVNSEVVPAFHLISLLNEGFSKRGEKGPGLYEKIIYEKQKGRIEDESGKTLTPAEMIVLLDSK